MRTPKEIRDTEFEKASRGYNIQDVDAFLSILADQTEELMREKDELQKKMMLLAEKVEEYRGDEDALRSALVSAERLKDNILQEAQQQKEIVLRDAQQKADKMIEEAQNDIEREEITLKALKLQVSAFKSEILAMYKTHIEVLNELPDAPADAEYDQEAVARLFAEKKPAVEPEVVVAEPVVVQAPEFALETVTAEAEPVAVSADDTVTYDGFAPRAEQDEVPVQVQAGPEFATFDSTPEKTPEKPESRFDKLDFGEDFTFGRE